MQSIPSFKIHITGYILFFRPETDDFKFIKEIYFEPLLGLLPGNNLKLLCLFLLKCEILVSLNLLVLHYLPCSKIKGAAFNNLRSHQ